MQSDRLSFNCNSPRHKLTHTHKSVINRRAGDICYWWYHRRFAW